MKVIVMAGLVTVEKIELASELATAFKKQVQSVVILDNIARLAIDQANFDVPVRRIAGDITIQLKDVLYNLDADIVLLALSEQVHPDDLFIAIDSLSDTIREIDVRTLALIDVRTCDCFPHLRESLEQNADVSIHLPYKLDEVLTHVSH
jgi:hypothetical protein